MQCAKCGFKNPEGIKFCGECGTRLEIICPECKFSNPASFKFCGECGFDLEKPKKISKIDYSEPQSYTPKHLADKILADRSAIEGERKRVTVLFADVADSTAMAENLDPEEVHQIMDGFFKIFMEEIYKYEGTVDKFTGDGAMALFGAPVALEDHAQRACYAGLSIQESIRDYGETIKNKYGLDFKMRVGLNSGPVIVGTIGDDLRMEYTAIGDTVNLASRMESTARVGSVLISRNTYQIVRNYFNFKFLGKTKVKGKKEPVEIYELTKASDIETRIDASVAKGLTRFVGRKNSMPALLEPFDKVQSGSGQVVGVVGEAGVGKSRLLMEFRSKLTLGTYTYLEGRCLHYGESILYTPILGILKAYFEIEDGDREFIIKKKIRESILGFDGEIEHTIPSFQDLLSVSVDDEEYLKLDPQIKRERTFEAIRDLFIRASQNKPLILAVEDLHWIDRTSEECLDYLIEWLANTPIMLILLYRTEYRHQWGSKTYYNRIGLDQLGTESSVELVKAMLEGGEVVPELKDLILSRSAGNPLFMEELTHSLLENGSIEKMDNQYVLHRDVSEVQVPDTIQGIIAARMDRLEENLKRTMQVASVIGREFAFRILQTIIEMKENLKANLLNLQGLEFIYEKSLFPELEYIFKHALTREVAYDSLLQKKRKEFHENIGRAIQQLYAERLEEFYEVLAYHYSNSDNFEKACQYLKLSGQKAARNYSNWEAVHFFKEALSKLKKMPADKENKEAQIEVLQLLSLNLMPLNFPEDSLQILQEGEKLSKEAGDRSSLASFYFYINRYYIHKGDPLTGINYVENSFREAEKIQDIELMVPNALALALAYNAGGEYSKVISLAPNVIDLIEKTGRESESFGLPYNAYSNFCSQYGLSLGNLGNFEESKVYLEKALRNAIKIGDLMTLGLGELWYGNLFLAKGDGKQTVEHAQNSIRYSEETKTTDTLGLGWSILGYGYYLLGDLETAQKHIEKGLEIHSDSGSDSLLSVYHILLSLIFSDSGDLRKATNFAEKSLELSKKNNERHWEGMSTIILGKTLGKMGPSQTDKAEEYILQGIKILEELKIRPFSVQGYLFLGEIYADTGQKEKAFEILKTAEAESKDMGMDYWLARTYAVYAELYKKEGDQSKAKENLSKAIEILKECGAEGWVEKYEKELAGIS